MLGILPSLFRNCAVKDRTKLRLGIAGTVIAALCCFTPVLVILLGLVGLSALTGYLDFVLFPALAFFLGLTSFALLKSKLNKNSVTADTEQ
jgi:mercuric ion transport protein